MDTDLNKTLTGMGESLIKIETRLETNTTLTEKIAAAVYGDNGEGLKTGFALLKQSVKRQWWLIGVIVAPIIGGAIWIIRSGLKN